MLIFLALADVPEDRSKIEIIYARCKIPMLCCAFRILGNLHDSEDAVHDAFLKIADIIDAIDDPLDMKTRKLVLTITRNVSIDLYRRRKIMSFSNFEETVLAHEGPGPDNIVDGESITAAIISLPEIYRDVLMLKYEYGFSPEEISGIISKSKAAVYKIIDRAKQQLETILKEEDIEI